MNDPRLRTYALLVLMVVIWGSYPALVKLALRDMPPFTLAALRCTLAAGLLSALLWRSGEQGTVSRADVSGLLVLGLCGITMSTGTFYLAIDRTTASNAVILTASTPVFVAVGGHLFFGERLRRLQWLGVLTSALGVLLTVTRGEVRLFHSPPHAGDGIALLGQVGWATYTLFGKRVLVRLSPHAATTFAYVIGSLVLAPLAVVLAPIFPVADPPTRFWSATAWAVVIFQGTLGTLSHVWYYRGVQAVGPSVTAIFMNLQPLVGLALATLLLGERLGLAQFCGTLLILAGVWLTTRR